MSNKFLVGVGAAAVVIGLVVSVGRAVAAADVSLEAETFGVSPRLAATVDSDSTASGRSALDLRTNATATVTVSTPASSAVVVRAKGQLCSGAPAMTVSLDGKNVAQNTVSATAWTDYSTAVSVAAGTHTIVIRYANDFNFLCDRRLLVDRVTLLASTPTTTPTTTTTTTPTTSTTPTTTTPTTTTPTTTTTVPTTVPPASSATAAAPFTPSGPFKTAIPASATLDPKSAAMVTRMTRENGMYANLVDFGVPVFTSSTSSSRYTVKCTITTWGTCPFAGAQVPIPDNAAPNKGSDGAMVVVDESSRKVYEFWQAKKSGGQWTTSWGAVNSLDGTGWGGNSTGSGASRLAGLVRVNEIAQGQIPHALVIQIDNACSGTFRAPAVKTDGTSTRSDCIPEGARVRLDPTVNLATLTMTPAARTIATALQVYGAYVIDVGGSPLSLSFERDTSAASTAIGSVYQNAGLRWDYDNIPGIPYNRLQVLS